MAHSLGLEVVAEGVETEEQIKFLRHHRCDTIQGYNIARPLVPEQFAEWVLAHQPNNTSQTDILTAPT